MNDKQHASLKQYVNDMIALERDIINAVKGQLEDDRIGDFSELGGHLDRVIADAEYRSGLLKKISDQEGASLGATVKEGITSVTGALAGIYGKLREHPVSRMVRDDIIALEVTSVSYGMLLTLGLSIGHDECVAIAQRGIEETPSLIIALTDLLPTVVASELAADGPLVNPAAVQVARENIRDAWKKC